MYNIRQQITAMTAAHLNIVVTNIGEQHIADPEPIV